MDPRDQTSRTLAGKAAYKQDMLQVYFAAGTEFSVLFGPYTFTNTRTENGFLAGYKADSMLKLFSDFAKLL